MYLEVVRSQQAQGVRMWFLVPDRHKHRAQKVHLVVAAYRAQHKQAILRVPSRVRSSMAPVCPPRNDVRALMPGQRRIFDRIYASAARSTSCWYESRSSTWRWLSSEEKRREPDRTSTTRAKRSSSTRSWTGLRLRVSGLVVRDACRGLRSFSFFARTEHAS